MLLFIYTHIHLLYIYIEIYKTQTDITLSQHIVSILYKYKNLFLKIIKNLIYISFISQYNYRHVHIYLISKKQFPNIVSEQNNYK